MKPLCHLILLQFINYLHVKTLQYIMVLKNTFPCNCIKYFIEFKVFLIKTIM